MPRPPIVTRTPLLPALWIWLGAWASCSGWLLSAAHRLDATGYVVALLLGVGVCVLAWKMGTLENIWTPSFHRLKHRAGRPLPLAFFILAALAFLGGALYLPSNYDGLAYRTPRVLHWLSEGHWHWIHTRFPSLNTRSTGYEWLTVPFLVFTKSDRGFFLINFTSLLLMPGLIFSTMTRLGVRPRVAWHWMWPLASGYCFSLEAGSIQSDLIGAPYALAMLDFALRARTSKRVSEVWLSILAAALLTGSKSSNLPLLLPWALALVPSWRIALRHPFGMIAVTAVAALCSFLPSAILNTKYCGDWTGLVIEHQPYGKNPAVRMALNWMVVSVHNLVPPVFPFARQWNNSLGHTLPSGLQRALIEHAGTLKVFEAPELAVEENSGLGLGVCALLGISLVALARSREHAPENRAPKQNTLDRLILLSPYLSALVLSGKAFVVGSGTRYFIPYFIPLVAPLLVCAMHERLVHRRWWRTSALAVIALAAVPLILTPARPLWPARTVFSFLEKRSFAPLVTRSRLVYETFAERPDCFAPVRQFLPPDEHTIGFVTADDPETSLWRPFGTLRIRHVLPGDTADDLRNHGINAILVNLNQFPNWFGPDESFDRWLEKIDAQLLRKFQLRLQAGSLNANNRDWAVVRLRPAVSPHR